MKNRKLNGQFKSTFMVKWGHRLNNIGLVVLLVGVALGGWEARGELKPTYAETIKEVPVVVVATTTAPVLDRIAKCESGNSHYDRNGQVLMVANTNGSVDIGVMQVNQKIWGNTATKMGFNLAVEKDNRAFAQYLYANYGSEPWVWSKTCWNK